MMFFFYSIVTIPVFVVAYLVGLLVVIPVQFAWECANDTADFLATGKSKAARKASRTYPEAIR